LEAPGKAIVAPTSHEERQHALLEAALRPDVFRRVYEYYRGKKLPESQFFANTLMREFNIPKEIVDRFVEVFTSNVEYLGLVKDGSTGKWLSSEMSPALDASSEKKSSLEQSEPTETSEVLRPKPVSSAPLDVLRTQKNAIFIGHGKDKGPLGQLKKILDEYHLPYKVRSRTTARTRSRSYILIDKI
jgi:hypothetical protein